jgi:aquaporin Z
MCHGVNLFTHPRSTKFKKHYYLHMLECGCSIHTKHVKPRQTCLSQLQQQELTMSMAKKLGAEFIGTGWLVLGGCGSAVLAAAFPGVGIGLHGVSLAFGLTVLTMAYAIAPISGCHLNPAVTIGLATAGRHPWSETWQYIIAQVLGGIAGAAILWMIASGKAGADLAAGGFAANGYGDHSPGKYTMMAALVCEVVMTAMFLIVILGSTAKRAAAGFAPLAIGLCLTLIHLISIPVTNTSVNPARSTSQAVFVGGWAVEQLWLFWLAPIVGAVIGAFIYNAISEKE